MNPRKEQEINVNAVLPWSIKARLTKIISILLTHHQAIIDSCPNRDNSW
ncbi:hypothetical protein [Leptospira interrogans]|nr:hypothetical protein [Leptospira interrogans]